MNFKKRLALLAAAFVFSFGIALYGLATAPTVMVENPTAVVKENLSKENLSKENLSKENLSKENLSKENLSKENLSAEIL